MENVGFMFSISIKRLTFRVSHMLNNWVDGVTDEAYYPWESPKKIRLKSVNPTFVTEQKKVLIHC